MIMGINDSKCRHKEVSSDPFFNSRILGEHSHHGGEQTIYLEEKCTLDQWAD